MNDELINALMDKKYGNRMDGTAKSSRGWLGPKINAFGKTMTEFSLGEPERPDDPLRPSLVPSLNNEEVQFLQQLPENTKAEVWTKTPVGRNINKKSRDWHKMRTDKGLSAFFDGLELVDGYER